MAAPMKIIIAGGGIAGLTLANALEQANIDYILLERRRELAPQVGASIGIMSNGARVGTSLLKLLDLDIAHIAQIMDQSGYGFAFSDRQDILQVLYDNIKDKSKIHVGKKLSQVRQHSGGVTVICEDDTSYTGDILAGADGVNSKARSEMWRLADEVDSELVKADKNSLECSYRCLYGIASSSAGLTIGDLHIGYNKNCSLMTIVGKDDRTYYFAFEMMDEIYKLPHIPTYTETDKVEYAERLGGLKATESVCLKDIHKHSVSSFGGNAAIESAAALANSIKKLADQTQGARPSEDQIVACLQDYQKNREIRAKAAIDASSLLTRLQAHATWGHVLFAKYGLTILGDFLENLGSNMAVGATLIDYLSPPEQSIKGTLPFNPEQGDGHKENLLVRAMLAVPFLGLFGYAWSIANPTFINTGNESSLGFAQNATGQSDVLTGVYVSASGNFDAAAGHRIATLLAYFGVVLAIWSIESVRRCNALMPVQLPSLFAIFAQVKGIGLVAPLYYFLHWVLTPIDSFKATDMRLTRLNYTRSILPSLLMVYYFPILQDYFLPVNVKVQTWLQIWHFFPIWQSLTQWAISKFLEDTIDHDKIYAPKRDVSTIRYTIAVPALVSTAVWLWTVFKAPSSLYHIFIPQIPFQAVTDIESFTDNVVQWNLLIFVASTYLWLVYFAWDAKSAGMLEKSWFELVTTMTLLTIALGPGGTVGLAYLYREYIITEKRHRAALTVESVRKRAAAIDRKL
ncbi:FAD/NAD(P)-binding domain-containing protein [Aureobasidium subglaciale]|nr:FAD/NAD(P)-binding domain-containing protein [Aureobasidium subglaciale]KAI5213753.1 FAD/NAD(P)-binding domain-containing protein [Aureobasidium subglaciale]KAI5215626.1 FAD/NAD(P)-binding domain-containing protein [Aureobasidium subglaciale]KAI5253657.1 FAD/NAD(P)-binding domain-containing protein [Aureobasidium subglaciale]